MLQSLKQKTLVGKLWAIIVLAVAAIFIGVVFGPGIAKNDRWDDPFRTAG